MKLKSKLSRTDLLERILVNDTSDRWYIDFYLYDDAGKLKRERVWIPMRGNKHQTLALRLAEIKEAILKGGFFQANDASALDLEDITLIHACYYVMNTRMGVITTHGYKTLADFNPHNSELSKASHRLYAKFIDYLTEWLESIKAPNMLLKSFNRQRATSYFQWAREVKKLKPASLETNKAFLRSMFNYFIDYHDLHYPNPLKVIKIRVPESDLHMPYTYEQLRMIEKWCDKKDMPQLWMFFMFVHYAFIRPYKELMFLKRKHIGTDYIIIEAKNAKNNKSLPIRIVPDLEYLIQYWKLREGDAEEWIFSKDMLPGRYTPTPTKPQYWFEKMRKELLLPVNCTLYSFKSTGAIHHYRENNNILELRNMMRHSSLNTTAKYLRKYGQVVWAD